MSKKSARWTPEQYRQLIARGMVQPEVSAVPPAAPAPKRVQKAKVPRPETPQITEMRAFLTLLNVPYVTEHRFHKTRRWRFDIALPDHLLAFEYEGIFSAKSRHTTYGGYSEDAVKYNEAALLGWRVFRYTGKNVKDFKKHIVELLKLPTNVL